jgi:hypothetical protein
MNIKKSFLALVNCLSVLAFAACTPSAPEAVTANGRVEVVFESPREEIVGGARLAPAVESWDGFGETVAVHGDVLVIGASEWNMCGPGSAYVYRRSGEEWQPEQQLMPSDREAIMQQAWRYEGQRFGTAVAIGDNLIAVGAPGNAYPTEREPGEFVAGAVYLFEYDGRSWVETAALTGEPLEQEPAQTKVTSSACPSRMKPRSFGALVALDGETVAVGGDARGDTVYIFQRGENGWQEQARIPLPGLTGRELHMVSMDLAGDTLAVSAFYASPQPDRPHFLAGNVTVYVFERNGGAWTETLRFQPEGETELHFFREVNVGAAVALGSGAGQADLLAVGLPGFPDWSGVQEHVGMFGVNPDPEMFTLPASNRQTGAVYLFERAENGGWSQQATLKPAGWQDAPGPGALWSGIPAVAEAEQGSSEGGGYPAGQPPPPPLPPLGGRAYDETVASPAGQPPPPGGSGAEELDSPDPGGFWASTGLTVPVVFPGDLYSVDPEVTFFGATVDLDGNRLAVTAGFANATYVFERQGQDWVYLFSVTPETQAPFWEDFAQVVRISGDTLLLGTPSEFGNSAYVFTLPQP